MSHDGIGNKGEYVRFGLKQDVWLKNYNRFISENIQVDVQVCYNVFNCLQLEKMEDSDLQTRINKLRGVKSGAKKKKKDIKTRKTLRKKKDIKKEERH